MGYKKRFIPPKVTATCNILNHTLIYSISLLASIVVYHHLCSQTVSTNGSPPKTGNMARPGGLFGTQQRREDNSESSENSSHTATGKDSPFGKQTYQYQPPHGYGYPLSQQPFPGAPQFYQHSPFNMTYSSHPTTSARQGYQHYGPPWQEYNLHQGGYGGSQMFPPPQIPGRGPSSPGAPRVPPGPPENHPVNQLTSSSSNPPPGTPSGAPRRPLIGLPMKRFQPPTERRETHAARIAELPPLPELSYGEYDADDKSDDSSDLGSAEGKSIVSLKQTAFSLKQFAKRMGQANYSAFNKWKKVWVAGFLEKKHRSIIRGQNDLKQVRDGPLYWATVVADFLETFEVWLPLDNFDNAEWICQQWVEMFLKKCASEIREPRKKGRRGNKRPATDLGEK